MDRYINQPLALPSFLGPRTISRSALAITYIYVSIHPSIHPPMYYYFSRCPFLARFRCLADLGGQTDGWMDGCSVACIYVVMYDRAGRLRFGLGFVSLPPSLLSSRAHRVLDSPGSLERHLQSMKMEVHLHLHLHPTRLLPLLVLTPVRVMIQQ